jgi:hypothetical protein
VSTSIRPPGSAPAAGIGEASDVRGVGAAGEVQGSEAKGVGEAARSSEAARTAPVESSATASWIQRLEAREISRAEAIEGLVAQALEAQGGAHLSPAQRSELESVLRSALLEDPVLGRLLGGG